MKLTAAELQKALEKHDVMSLCLSQEPLLSTVLFVALCNQAFAVNDENLDYNYENVRVVLLISIPSI